MVTLSIYFINTLHIQMGILKPRSSNFSPSIKANTQVLRDDTSQTAAEEETACSGTTSIPDQMLQVS